MKNTLIVLLAALAGVSVAAGARCAHKTRLSTVGTTSAQALPIPICPPFNPPKTGCPAGKVSK